MNKVVTVQDFLIKKDPEKYKPMFTKEAIAETKAGKKEENELKKLRAENKELKARLKELLDKETKG